MSFPRYPSYKDSGVEWLGEVPEHWEVCALKRIVAMQSGESITGETIEEAGEYPVFGGNGLRGYTSGFTHNGKFVLIGRQGALCGNINYASGKFWASEHAVVATPVKQVDTVWLGEMLRSMNLNQYSVAAAQPGLSVDLVGRLGIGVPPLPEQTQIAAFLDRETAKIDGLVADQRRLMELLKEKRQAVISHAVTQGLNPHAPMKPSGIEWLGDVPEQWKIGKLSRLVSTRKGIAFKADHFTDEGVNVVKASDIKGLTIRQSETCLPSSFLEQYPQAILKTGELVLSTVGSAPEVRNSAVGQIGKVPDALSESLLNQNTVVFTPSTLTLTNDFLFFILQTVGYRDHLDLYAHGTANQASINVSDMLDFFVPLPRSDEQIKITRFISDEFTKFGTLTAEAQRAIDLLQERRTALISAAVTGQIDVRPLCQLPKVGAGRTAFRSGESSAA